MVTIPFLLKCVHLRTVFRRILRTVSSVMNDGIPAFIITRFLQKCFPSLLPSTWFALRYFFFVEETVLAIFCSYFFITSKSQYYFSCASRWLLLNTLSMLSSSIFLNNFFLYLHSACIKYRQLMNTSNGTLCKYLTKSV